MTHRAILVHPHALPLPRWRIGQRRVRAGCTIEANRRQVRSGFGKSFSVADVGKGVSWVGEDVKIKSVDCGAVELIRERAVEVPKGGNGGDGGG
jgi:hypothetical protein